MLMGRFWEPLVPFAPFEPLVAGVPYDTGGAMMY